MKTELTIISDDLNHGIIDEKEAQTLLLGLLGVSGSTFSINELHALHSGLITAKPHLNERTEGYKTTINLIKKLSSMVAEYYR